MALYCNIFKHIYLVAALSVLYIFLYIIFWIIVLHGMTLLKFQTILPVTITTRLYSVTVNRLQRFEQMDGENITEGETSSLVTEVTSNQIHLFPPNEDLGDIKGENTDEDVEKVTIEEEEFAEDAEALKEELEKIIVVFPEPEAREPAEVFDPAEFPSSYKNNLPKEQIVLQYADSFRCQYVHLYRDRKPLLLCPVNECGIEKFVCTTIQPSQLPFKELYNWEDAAEFVADYLNFETLNPSYELPTRLLSPTTVLKRQKGNCFEYSTLLCCLLIGAGYDAYVVSGYATRETCLADESREICPLLKKKEEEKKEEQKKVIKKYTVKPPKDLQSKFELKMEARRQLEQKIDEDKRRAEEEQKQTELEKPPPDPLHGRRIHSWILILSGKREVPESFFIEPFTGLSHPTNSEAYLGIESLWNNINYWVCMQDCSDGVAKLSYDLQDCVLWEFIFPGMDKPQLLIPEAEDDLLDNLDDDEEKEEEEHYLDLPPSWVEPLKISQKEFEMRCPQGKKTKLYKRAKLEKFAHYLMPDGLVSRLSVFSDKELTDLIMVKEYYEHQIDKLYLRVHNHRSGWVTEYFHPGHSKFVKEHCYRACAPEAENDRTMYFYEEARVDDLVKRIETPLSMTEHFKRRDDFLYYKHVDFGKRTRKFGPQDEVVTDNPRPIVKMTQRFERNPSKQANLDIRELIFHVAEDRIQLTYHTEKKSVASSTREFVKPHNWDEKGITLTWSPDMHATFQADPNSKSSKQVELYENLLRLLQLEETCKETVRESEKEVKEIINDRKKEAIASELEISVYDTERNEKAKTHRTDLEYQQMEEKMRKQETEIDYLAPFLAQMDNPEISRVKAYKLKEDCLADLKHRLINKANLIQSRFEKETQELQKKQSWYQQHQFCLTKEEEEEYLNYCSEAMFIIHILELRLNRHKEMAPHKYMAMEQKLRNDPRLSEYF